MDRLRLPTAYTVPLQSTHLFARHRPAFALSSSRAPCLEDNGEWVRVEVSVQPGGGGPWLHTGTVRKGHGVSGTFNIVKTWEVLTCAFRYHPTTI